MNWVYDLIVHRRKEEGKYSFYMVGGAEPSPNHKLYGARPLRLGRATLGNMQLCDSRCFLTYRNVCMSMQHGPIISVALFIVCIPACLTSTCPAASPAVGMVCLLSVV